MRILLIEDDDGIRNLIKMGLNRDQYDVEMAEDGYEAQARLKDNVPDLILMDIMMPDINGIELCRWIQSQPHLKGVPIISMSALKDEQTIHDAMEAGVLDFISKPINFDSLNEKIQLAVKRAKRRSEMNGDVQI